VVVVLGILIAIFHSLASELSMTDMMNKQMMSAALPSMCRASLKPGSRTTNLRTNNLRNNTELTRMERGNFRGFQISSSRSYPGSSPLYYCLWLPGVVLFLCTTLFLLSGSANAQSGGETANTAEESVDRLEILQSLIDTNTAAREELRSRIKTAEADQISELQQELDRLNQDLTTLRSSFEQVAIGAIDVELLGEIDTSFDWRMEVTQILQPIVENLKALTDKPRKISKLQALIEQTQIQSGIIDSALLSIEAKRANSNNPKTQSALEALNEAWKRRKSDNAQSYEIAQLQLAELQNTDVNWWEAVRTAIRDFMNGRGLTLLISAAAALLVWFLMRAVLHLFQRKTKHMNQDEYRTRTRLAQYAYRALMLLLILIAVISVFYVRGDLLLMGLSILAAAAIALGLRQAIPRFLSEAKLLLNLGSIRENERVFYNGLPWQVVSVNMNSVLRNPELTGVIRLPLAQLSSMISRPAGKEPWFPASKNDFIVTDDDQVREVIRLTPETVELRDRGGTITAVPASEFYNWSFRNLSRGTSFGISTIFGIDYRHQNISLSKVPSRFKLAIEEALNNTEQANAVLEVLVEFKSAGSSSLDFWIYVTLEPGAAKAYAKLGRLIQQTCVAVCTDEQWGIPFPHITIQQLENEHA